MNKIRFYVYSLGTTNNVEMHFWFELQMQCSLLKKKVLALQAIFWMAALRIAVIFIWLPFKLPHQLATFQKGPIDPYRRKSLTFLLSVQIRENKYSRVA